MFFFCLLLLLREMFNLSNAVINIRKKEYKINCFFVLISNVCT